MDTRFPRTMIAGSLFMLASLSCSTDTPKPVVRQTTAMNTYVNISVYDDLRRERIDRIIDSAVAEIQRIENMATDYSDSSEVGKINLAAGVDSISVSQELIGLIRQGIAYGNLSGGKLDITIGKLVKMWDFIGEHPRALSQQEVDSLVPFVDYRKLAINDSQVFLPSQRMRLDLGSIGKGYAIERAADKLKSAGLKKFIVDIGGKLKVSFEGTHLLDSTVAEILVRHPRKDGEYFGGFKVGTGAVSTSGDYQRYFIEKGVRYHHLLDPATGFPARGIVAVTVVTEDALDADALSTVAFLLGREKGMEFIRHTLGLEGIIIYEDGDSLKYEITQGLAHRFVRDGEEQR
jgi:thiamine biosynthesis lipoprotein